MEDTAIGGRILPFPSYHESVGVLSRRSKSRSRVAATHRFVCYLDRIPPHVLEDEAFRVTAARGPAVECELEAEDFGAAVAEAIRSLEHGFARVEAIERLTP
jgi:hypothetical protein